MAKGFVTKKIMVKFAGSPCIHHCPGFSCLHAHPPLHRFNKWDQNDHANVIIQSVFHSTLEIFSQCAFLTSFSRSKGGAFPDRLLLFCQLVDNPAGERDLPSKCQQSKALNFFFTGAWSSGLLNINDDNLQIFLAPENFAWFTTNYVLCLGCLMNAIVVRCRHISIIFFAKLQQKIRPSVYHICDRFGRTVWCFILSTDWPHSFFTLSPLLLFMLSGLTNLSYR